ncbi:hypothetical protein O3P69_009139 [Scylla paramamosain]|uniref:Amino acid transporter transmembrane domain-containing protein n=1 Tax=Scylla paramamosain TaxID=85552 RepID=A0AAW0TA35_SCYPA
MAGNTRHVVNMANSIVGVSILSMPYCFKESGLLLGVLMVLFSGFVTKKTCMFLVRAATMARHHSYEFLAFHVFGVRGKLAVELCMILFLIGICISFHVVMGDLAPALAAQVFRASQHTITEGHTAAGHRGIGGASTVSPPQTRQPCIDVRLLHPLLLLPDHCDFLARFSTPG